jgi:hypothetical protein
MQALTNNSYHSETAAIPFGFICLWIYRIKRRFTLVKGGAF